MENDRRVSVLCIAAICIGMVAGECRFPDGWHGRWFQSGLGQVVIREHSIIGKGTCQQNHRDLYLLENKEQRCQQCVLIVQRHKNIIQYKESYCVGPDSFDAICHYIRVEATLYTLVREPSVPVPCPFQQAYLFNYNNNSGGFCRTPPSYVRQCAGDSRFSFKFQHCDDSAYTHNKDLELQCLATWKHGSDLYLYGGFSGPGLTEKDDIYRCFLYQVLGTVVYIAMSADATCRGIRSQRDGPLVMEFTKDTYGWPQATCNFPDWFGGLTWIDLSGKHVYVLDDNRLTLTMSFRRRPGTTSHARSSLRCLHMQQYNATSGEAVILSYTSDECDARYQCVRIRRRHDNVIEVERGVYVKSETERCGAEQFHSATKHLIIPKGLTKRNCPYKGRYYLTQGGAECQLDVYSGCSTSSQMDIVSACVPHPIGQLECLEWWTEGEKKYVIAKKLGDNSDTANCFSFQHRGDTIEFSTDRHCNHGIPNILERKIRYTLNDKPASCEHKVAIVTPAPDKDRGGGSEYKHTVEVQENEQSAVVADSGISGASRTSAIYLQAVILLMGVVLGR